MSGKLVVVVRDDAARNESGVAGMVFVMKGGGRMQRQGRAAIEERRRKGRRRWREEERENTPLTEKVGLGRSIPRPQGESRAPSELSSAGSRLHAVLGLEKEKVGVVVVV